MQIVANSTPEGFLISVSAFLETVTKVVLTITDNVLSGDSSGNNGAYTFTKLKKTGETVIDFTMDVSDLVSGREYLIIAEGKTASNSFAGAASTHTIYVGIPEPYSETPTPASIDKAIRYDFTGNSVPYPEDIKYVQFIVSDLSNSSIDFSATMDASDVFGHAITLRLDKASSTKVDASANNVLSVEADAEFENGFIYEVAVIYSNDTGAALKTTTSTIVPSAIANTPTSITLTTGSGLGSTDASMNGKIGLTFTRGAQIQGFPDTQYTVDVSGGGVVYTKIFPASEVNLTDSDVISILLFHGDSGWNTNLSLVNGTSYSIAVSASNQSGPAGDPVTTSEPSQPESATPSGLPPKYIFSAEALVAGSATFTLTTGALAGNKVLITTFADSVLSTVAQNNGSAISGIVIALYDVSNNFVESSDSTTAIIGGEITFSATNANTYNIKLHITNGNGTTSTDFETKVISSTPDPVDNIVALPADNTPSSLGPNTISLTWGTIGAAGNTDAWGGYSAETMAADPGSFGYYVYI